VVVVEMFLYLFVAPPTDPKNMQAKSTAGIFFVNQKAGTASIPKIVLFLPLENIFLIVASNLFFRSYLIKHTHSAAQGITQKVEANTSSIPISCIAIFGEELKARQNMMNERRAHTRNIMLTIRRSR